MSPDFPCRVAAALALGAALAAQPAPALAADAEGLAFGQPDEQGMDARPLIALAEWVRDASPQIFSILVSRRGVVVYELYTSSLTREHAHYLMSITKSVTSALVGVVIARKLVAGPDVTIADALPASLFESPAARARFRGVTIEHVLGMSALDALVPPHRSLPEDVERLRQFYESPNRAAFALTQPLLPKPGTSFQYTDVTPLIATGIVQYAAKKSALELAEEALFVPMRFRNHEWMHQDKAGIDNGAYGLRLRPIDMQKLGVLYLQLGTWEKRQLLPRAWVERSFTPCIRSSPELPAPDYGWYWWTRDYGRHWRVHTAQGWKGQRILVVPEQGVVVTMTALAAEAEQKPYEEKVMSAVIASVEGTKAVPHRVDRALRKALAEIVETVRQGPLRAPSDVEPRMVPSIAPKEQHRPFRP